MVTLTNTTKIRALLRRIGVGTGLVAGLLLIGCSNSNSDSVTLDSITESGAPEVVEEPQESSTLSTPLVRGDLAGGDPDPVAAALGIAEWKQQLVEVDRTKVRELVTLVAHPDWVDALTIQAAAETVLLDEQAPAGASLKLAPIELRLLSQTDTTAEVEIWAAQIVTGAGGIYVGYSTLIVSLSMSDGVWLLADLNSRPGPVPTPTQAITDPLVFVAELTGFSDAQQATQ